MDNAPNDLFREAADALADMAGKLADMTRERDEANASYDQCGQFIERQNETIDRLDVALGTSQQEVERLRVENDRLRAALADLEDEVRILLRDNDVEVTEGMSCAIDIAREALKADAPSPSPVSESGAGGT
jgi:septal ring factor EnvC (AmiA/AmiB activator)